MNFPFIIINCAPYAYKIIAGMEVTKLPRDNFKNTIILKNSNKQPSIPFLQSTEVNPGFFSMSGSLSQKQYPVSASYAQQPISVRLFEWSRHARLHDSLDIFSGHCEQTLTFLALVSSLTSEHLPAFSVVSPKLSHWNGLLGSVKLSKYTPNLLSHLP